MKAVQVLGIISVAIFIPLANAQNPEPPQWDKSKQSYGEYVEAVSAYNDQLSKQNAKLSKQNAEVLCKSAPKALKVGMAVAQLQCIMIREPGNKTTTTDAYGESVLYDYGSIWIFSRNGIVTRWIKSE